MKADNLPEHDDLFPWRRIIMAVGIVVFLACVMGMLWHPDGPADVPRCIVVQDETNPEPVPGLVEYRAGIWYDSDGRISGYATTEDGTVWNAPHCP